MKNALTLTVVIGLCLSGLAGRAGAQTQGVLGVPPKGQSIGGTGTPLPPAPAPRGSVQQVAPLASQSLLGKASKPTPVVQPPKNSHAQKTKSPAKPVAPGAAPTAATGAVAVDAGAPGTAGKPTTEIPAQTAAAKPETSKPDPSKGTVTGAPVPRWATFRADEVNLRTGPGTRYPIEWQYHRRDLPVQIQREFEVWRLIEDQDGVKGWVHQATLTGRRGFVVKVADQTLRKSAADDGNPVAVLKVGVVGRIRACDAKASWCEVDAGGYRGWIRREAIWGIFPDEAIN